MRIIILALCTIGAAFAHEELLSRENEPDPREYMPFKMPAMIKHVCESMRWFLEQQRESRPRNALQLSQLFVEEFDSNEDGCISGNEIRDIAARFRGNLAGYRTIFQHVLDENKSGCVEAEELNSLVLDCIMPSQGRMRGMPASERYSSSFNREEMARILEEPKPVEDVVVGEEEETEVTLETSQEEQDTKDRRAMLEEANVLTPEASLNPAVKEMICSMIRREHEDAEFGLRTLAEVVDLDGVEGLSYEEVFEFLSASRIPRVESDDLAAMMDSDSDSVVTVEELMESLDNCPVMEVVDVLVVKTRPITNFEDVECQSKEAMYKELRTKAMKFLGTRKIRFEEAKDAAAELYASISGDIEEVIEPKDLDVPVDCVKEVWQDIDTDLNGFLDLIEFNRIALDIFEEFLPKPVKKTKPMEIERVQIEDMATPLEDVPRIELDTIAQIVYKICREGGVRIPESDVERVVGLLLQDASIATLMDKVQSVGMLTEEAENTLASLVRPIVYQLLSE
ncbi:uncharacterized protein LOC134822302 [Bolinopsis microptera]|uniref:uncharacterized protein LOC134822302 n=1 Tax=Bolinopsis microptera TaxID=2820187 RepID=UPI0030790893